MRTLLVVCMIVGLLGCLGLSMTLAAFSSSGRTPVVGTVATDGSTLYFNVTVQGQADRGDPTNPSRWAHFASDPTDQTYFWMVVNGWHVKYNMFSSNRDPGWGTSWGSANPPLPPGVTFSQTQVGDDYVYAVSISYDALGVSPGDTVTVSQIRARDFNDDYVQSYVWGGEEYEGFDGQYSSRNGLWISCTGSFSFVLPKASAEVTLSDLTHTYDGTPKRATVTTDPSELGVIVTYDGVTTEPVDAGEYAVVATVDDPGYEGSATGTLTINKATPIVTEWPTASDITYGDSLADSTLTGGVVDPYVEGTFSFHNPSIRPKKATDFNMYVQFTPTDTRNYNTVREGIVWVTVHPAILTVTAHSGQSKVYGEADPAYTYDVTGFQFDDDEGIITGTLSRETGESVGIYPLTKGDLAAGDNYTISFVSADFQIAPRELTLFNFVADDRQYLRSTRVTGDGFDDDRVPGDDLEFSYDVAFEDKHVGDDKTVYFTNIEISGGADQHNYNLLTTSGTTTASIWPRPIRLDDFVADDKVYDGTTDVTGDGFRVIGRVSGDELEFSWDAAFEDKHVGDDKTVYFTNIEISGGADQYNYSLVTTEGTATADITVRPITVTADAGQSRVYGNDDPELTWEITDGELAEGDEITGALDREEGEAVSEYAITLGTLAIEDGNDGNNYDLTFVSNDFEITARPIEVTADDQSKVYGEDDPDLTYMVTDGSLAFDDAFEGELERVAGENVGTYAIQQGTLSIDAIANYDFTFLAGTLTISQATLTITADDQSKRYDAEPFTDFTVSFEGFVDGEGPGDLGGSLAFGGGAVDAVEPGSYIIEPGGLTSANYNIVFESGILRIRPYYDYSYVDDGIAFVDRAVVGGAGMFEDLLIEALYEVGQNIVVQFTISDFYDEEVTDAAVVAGLFGAEDRPRPLVYASMVEYDEELGRYCLEIPTEELEPGLYFLDLTGNDGSHFQELLELVEPIE